MSVGSSDGSVLPVLVIGTIPSFLLFDKKKIPIPIAINISAPRARNIFFFEVGDAFASSISRRACSARAIFTTEPCLVRITSAKSLAYVRMACGSVVGDFSFSGILVFIGDCGTGIGVSGSIPLIIHYAGFLMKY